MDCTIFYSWQSDLSSKTNRSFILDVLNKAAKHLQRDDSILVEPRVDHDTAGVAGSPDIAGTIFAKIRSTQVFVCDVSIINANSKFRKTPNPNVLVELGYAISTLGLDRIIMIINTAYGEASMLPFDLQGLRLLPYHLPASFEDKVESKRILEPKLRDALKLILLSQEKETDQSLDSEDDTGANLALKMKFRRGGAVFQGKGWEAYKLEMSVTSINHVASENGAMRLTLANPLMFGRTTAAIFGSSPEETGLFDDEREENPHAQSLKVTWNSSRGTVILPDDWHNFYGNAFSLEGPSPEIIPNPTYLFQIELFTTNRRRKKQLYFVERLSTGEFNIGVVDKQNQEEILQKFWATYHTAREKTR